MSNVQILIGDCRDILKTIPSKSVKLVVTSPPYNIGKPYGKYKDKIPLNEWEELIDEVTKEIYRVLTDDGSFFLNLSPIPYGKDKEILPLPYIGYDIVKENKFYLKNMITWHFNNMQNCTNRLSGRYENIIWAVKDMKNYIFNLDDVRIPYITKNDKRLTGKGRNPTDVWYFNRVNNMTKKKYNLQHPTIYPLPMIERIVKMSSNEGDTVLDPFAGSGTTLVAANLLNRNSIGIELQEEKKKKAREGSDVRILTAEGVQALEKRAFNEYTKNLHITLDEMEVVATAVLQNNCYYCKLKCDECAFYPLLSRFAVPGVNSEPNCPYSYKETSTFDNLEYKEDASIYNAALEAQHIKKKIRKQIEEDKEKEAEKIRKEAKKKHKNKTDHKVSKRKQKKLKNRFDEDDGIEYSYKTKNFK